MNPTYEQARITRDHILDSVCAEIRRKLAFNDTLSNSGTVYTGVDYSYSISASFLGRAEQTLDATVHGKIRTPDEPDGEVVESVSASGTARAGKHPGRPKKETK